MKRNYIIPIILGIFPAMLSGNAKAQTILIQEDFTTYLGTPATVPAGWTFSANADYTTTASSGPSGPNSYKFAVTADSITTPTFSNADSVAFWIKGEGTDSASKLSVYYTTGSGWTLMDTIRPLPTKGTIEGFSVPNTATQLQFIYTKSKGNLAFDDFLLTQTTTTGIKDITSNVSRAFIYPNPAAKTLFVKFPKTPVGATTIDIYDITGRDLLKLPIEIPSANVIPVTISALSSGVYFISIKTGKSVQVQKFVRQ